MFDLDQAIRAWRHALASERALSATQLDELEDHLRSAYQSLMAGGLPPRDAWVRARESLGTPEELSAEFRKIDGLAWRRLIRIGWVMFALSFILPAHRYGMTLFNLDIGGGVLPGFQAFVFAVAGEAGAFGVASALTNIVMALTMWRVADHGRSSITALAAIMTAATLVNGWWIHGVDRLADLRMGYYVWLAAFGFVTTGLVLRARTLASRVTPVAGGTTVS